MREENLYFQLVPPRDQEMHDENIPEKIKLIRSQYPDQNVSMIHGNEEKHVKQTKYQKYRDISSLFLTTSKTTKTL